MLPLIFFLPKSRTFGAAILQVMPCERGDMEIRRFPDGETYIRYQTPVKGRDVILIAALDSPDEKAVQLFLAANIARENGAKSVGFIIPYLPYLRQDTKQHDGEGITSKHFATLISNCCDWLVTIDPSLPHSHRLADIYAAPIGLAHSAAAIAAWITINVERPILVGVNEENTAWLAEIAELAKCPYYLLQPALRENAAHLFEPDTSAADQSQPVILDMLVSTGEPMLQAIHVLHEIGTKPPICIAVHPLLVGDTYAALLTSGIDKLVSCNTIAHPTNRINVAPAVADMALKFLHSIPGNKSLQQRECEQIS